MKKGTHFDYNNHIAFISTHTNIGTPSANGTDSAFSNVVPNFRQCLPLIVSKLSTWDTNNKTYLGINKTSHGFVGSKRFTLVGGVGNDRLMLTVFQIVESYKH